MDAKAPPKLFQCFPKPLPPPGTIEKQQRNLPKLYPSSSPPPSSSSPPASERIKVPKINSEIGNRKVIKLNYQFSILFTDFAPPHHSHSNVSDSKQTSTIMFGKKVIHHSQKHHFLPNPKKFPPVPSTDQAIQANAPHHILLTFVLHSLVGSFLTIKLE